MIVPGCLHAPDGEGRVKCQAETEELEKNAEADARAPFEKAPNPDREEKSPDEDGRGDCGFLRLKQRS